MTLKLVGAACAALVLSLAPATAAETADCGSWVTDVQFIAYPREQSIIPLSDGRITLLRINTREPRATSKHLVVLDTIDSALPSCTLITKVAPATGFARLELSNDPPTVLEGGALEFPFAGTDGAGQMTIYTVTIDEAAGTITVRPE
ncbi:MAG: hypothetical protein AAF318_14280 [Pseudomonadota bacterium]